MKHPDQSWPDYLAHGISLMEGTSTIEPWSGQRWPAHAQEIFEECAAQESHIPVKVEAYFRRAQIAHYQRRTAEAKQWSLLGARACEDQAPLLPPDLLSRRYLTEAVVLIDDHQYPEAYRALNQAWKLAPKSFKIRGDIAHRLGRLFSEHGRELGYRQGIALSHAYSWFEKAIHFFESLSPNDLNTQHALVFASARAGRLCQQRFGYTSPLAQEHFQRAENLLATCIHDPHAHTLYWSIRARAALTCRHPWQALRHFCTCLSWYLTAKEKYAL